MNRIVYTVLGFAALWFFLPAPGETGLRNVPLFIAVLALIALSLLLKWIRVFLRMRRVSSLLRKNGCTVKRKIRRGSVSFTASHSGKVFRVLLFHRRRPHVRYHFDTAEFLEIYKTTAAVSKANIAGRFPLPRRKRNSYPGKNSRRACPIPLFRKRSWFSTGCPQA